MPKIKYIGKCLLLEDAGERVLVIGDLHLGYEGAMRVSGVMIPVKLYEKCIADFEEIYNYIINNLDGKIIIEKDSRLVHESYGGLTGSRLDREINDEGKKIDKIIILGDVKHEFGYILDDEWNLIVKFLEHLRGKCKELVVIEGNHDKILFPILRKMRVVAVDFYLWRNILFAHGDKEFEEMFGRDVKYWIIGHGHPAVTLVDNVKRETYKCFLTGAFKGKKVILVPSFFPLIAGTDAREFDLGFAFKFDLRKFNVKIVGDGLDVLDFGKLKDIDY